MFLKLWVFDARVGENRAWLWLLHEPVRTIMFIVLLLQLTGFRCPNNERSVRWTPSPGRILNTFRTRGCWSILLYSLEVPRVKLRLEPYVENPQKLTSYLLTKEYIYICYCDAKYRRR